MYADIEKKNGKILEISGESKVIEINKETIYLNGQIVGVVDKDYTINTSININNVLKEHTKYFYRLVGDFTIIISKDGFFEYALTDLSGKKELYYTTQDDQIQIGENLFELYKKNQNSEIHVNIDELNFFLHRGHCRPGKTYFEEVRRLSPGRILKINKSRLIIENCLPYFKGYNSDYSNFKKSLTSSIKQLFREDYGKEVNVMLSGGVDSTVVLGIAKKEGIPVTASTFKLKPNFDFNYQDVFLAEKICKKLNVEHDIVNVELNRANLSHFDKVIHNMPFVWDIGVNYLEIFKAKQNKSKIFLGGLNADVFYNINFSSIPYLKMALLAEKKKKIVSFKNLYDKCIKLFFKCFHKEDIIIPKDFNQILKYYSGIDKYPLLSEYKNYLEKNISPSFGEKILFDSILAGFFIKGEYKILFELAKMFDCKMILPYSEANMIYFFRNINKSFRDMLFPKQYIYRYAKEELNIKPKFFKLFYIKYFLQGKKDSEILTLDQWRNYLFNETKIGEELGKTAGKTIRTFKINNDDIELNLDSAFGLYYFNNVKTLLENIGVKIMLPHIQ